MRRSGRTNAALKNFRLKLDARGHSDPGASGGMTSRGPDQAKRVDPETQALIDEALRRRGGA